MVDVEVDDVVDVPVVELLLALPEPVAVESVLESVSVESGGLAEVS